MSITVGAALKKIVTAILGNPKLLKAIGGIVLGILIIIIMPIAVVICIFNGNIDMDMDTLQQQITDQIISEHKEKLQLLDETMQAVEDEMDASGFSDRVKEAQVLYTLALSEYANEPDFVSKLVGCFDEKQTDEQLIFAINSVFGTQLTATDFTRVMSEIRGYTN